LRKTVSFFLIFLLTKFIIRRHFTLLPKGASALKDPVTLPIERLNEELFRRIG
jgi:hypothetical protein